MSGGLQKYAGVQAMRQRPADQFAMQCFWMEGVLTAIFAR